MPRLSDRQAIQVAVLRVRLLLSEESADSLAVLPIALAHLNRLVARYEARRYAPPRIFLRTLADLPRRPSPTSSPSPPPSPPPPRRRRPMRTLSPPEAATLVLRIKPNARAMTPGWEVEMPSAHSARARPLIGADPHTKTWQTKGAWVYASVPGGPAAPVVVWLV